MKSTANVVYIHWIILMYYSSISDSPCSPASFIYLLHRFHHFFICFACQRLTLVVVTNCFLSDLIATFEIVILVSTTQTHWLSTSDAFEDLPFVIHDLYLNHVMMWFSLLLKFDSLNLVKFDLLYTLCVWAVAI